MKTKQKSYALPIAMMCALFFMISFVTGLANPLGIIVKNQFGVTNFMSTLGNAANFIAYAFMGIPSGLLLARIGYKKTALSAIIVGLIGISIQFLSGQFGNFGIYLAGAFVSGFSMCMLNTVVNPMLNTLGGGGKKGNQLIQVGGSINSIGATIVPVFVGYLMGDVAKATIKDANPALFIAMGIFALAFLVLFIMEIPEPNLVSKAKAEAIREHSPLSFRHFILGAIAIFIYVGIEVGIPNIANLFMTSAPSQGGLNINATIAGTVVGTYWFLMLLGRLTGASFGAKISPKAMLGAAASLAMILLLLAIFSPVTTTVKMPVFRSDISFGMAEVPISVMFLIFVGICTSVMWGSIFNLAVEGLGKYTAAGAGFFMVMVCGGGILPMIQGFVADQTSYISSYWVIFFALSYILFYALVGSKNINKDIPVE